MEYWTADKNAVKLVWRCHQLLSGFLAKGHFLRVSRQSRLSANDKGVNKMILGTLNRSPGICLQLRKALKTSARKLWMKTVWPVIASNGGPYFQMMSVGSHSTSGKQKEGKKERTARIHGSNYLKRKILASSGHETLFSVLPSSVISTI